MKEFNQLRRDLAEALRIEYILATVNDEKFSNLRAKLEKRVADIRKATDEAIPDGDARMREFLGVENSVDEKANKIMSVLFSTESGRELDEEDGISAVLAIFFMAANRLISSEKLHLFASLLFCCCPWMRGDVTEEWVSEEEKCAINNEIEIMRMAANVVDVLFSAKKKAVEEAKENEEKGAEKQEGE